MRRLFGWAILALLVVNAALFAQEPVLEDEGDRWLVLARLPSVLEEQDVAPHLTKGLTTTFVFVVDLLDVAGGKRAGAARVEIRYELWDEVFHTSALGVDGLVHRQEVSSRDELLDWWHRLRLVVVDREALAAKPRAQAQIKVDVAPFSRGEERDTQEWFAESMSSEGISSSVDGRQKRESGIFSVLIASSIRRRPLTSFHWTVDITDPDKP